MTPLRSAWFGLAAILLAAGCNEEPSPATADTPVSNEAPAAASEAAPPSAAPAPVPPPQAAVADPPKPDDASPKGLLPAAPRATTLPLASAARPAESGAAAQPVAEATASVAPAAEPAPTTVVSPKSDGSHFSVWMQSTGTAKVGQQAQVEVVLVAKGDFHCNDNYPYKLKLDAPPAGVTYPQPIVRREAMSLSPTRASMRVPFVASSPGEARISGKFHFSVCTAAQCVMDSRELAVTVRVE